MPPVAETASPLGRFEIDRASHSIRFAREIEAPRAQVFEAWTVPEHMRCWWDPAGAELATCEIDLRVGGSFRFVSRGHPDMPFAGTYREIAPPERLVFDAMGAKGRVTLDETRGTTRMIVEIVCPSAEHLEQFLKVGVDVGTNQTLDNLVAYCAGTH